MATADQNRCETDETTSSGSLTGGSNDVQQDAPILDILDDDCLLEIFQRLDFDDLKSVANVCIRFNQNAKKIFSSKFRTTAIGIGPFGTEDDNLLSNFGSMMESVELYSVNMLDRVSEHCSSLKALTIQALLPLSPFVNFVHLNEEIMRKFQSFFVNLEKLTFQNCLCTDHIKTALTNCRKLRYLKIVNNLLEEDHSEIVMYCDEEIQEREELMPFANLHSSELFQTIGEHAPNLEKLKIHVKYMDDSSNFQRDMLHLSSLRSLRVLELHCYKHSVAQLMESMATNQIQLEKIMLKDGDIDIDGIQHMCKLKSLVHVVICGFFGFNPKHLITLSAGLPLLTALHVMYPKYYSEHMDIAMLEKIIFHGKRLRKFSVLYCILNDGFGLRDYESILTIIQNRPEKIGFKMVLGVDGDESDEPFEMQTEFENGERLEVSTEIFIL